MLIDGCKWLMYIVGVDCWYGLLVKVVGVGVGVGCWCGLLVWVVGVGWVSWIVGVDVCVGCWCGLLVGCCL